MTANELRIGNLILDEEFDIIYTVDLDFFHDLVSGGFLMADLIPIPLTNEWLVKFGFEKNETYTYLKKNKFIIDLNENMSNYYLCDIDIRVDIKHVHQLQNLYFALTGEELKIN